ncbi:YfiM family protein [bacterium]|nr:YfiM family protein [bacterium]
MYKIVLIIFAATSSLPCFSQNKWFEYSDTLNKPRLISVVSGASAITIGTMLTLNEYWYKDFPRSPLHSFDDSKEWEGMDKVGHGFTSYYCGVLGYNALKWSGVSENKALLYGAWGFMYLAGIEFLDGYSTQWGFSWADMAANTAGSAFFIGQQLLWKEQRIMPKFSYQSTLHTNLRPELLGNGGVQEVLKNYNGQTYWLSTNIHSFLKEESKFPKWLSFSLGYGATGMLGGHDNPKLNAKGIVLPQTLQRHKQYYLSLDFDLHRIKTKSELLNGVLKAVSWFKFPLPTVEFSQRGVFFHPVYF